MSYSITLLLLFKYFKFCGLLIAWLRLSIEFNTRL